MLADEIERVDTALADHPEAPYYLGYQAVDHRGYRLTARNGAIAGENDSHWRAADVDLRVGSPELDSTHEIRDGSWMAEEMREQAVLPLDGDPRATRLVLWRVTDDAWRSARRRLTQVEANEQVKVDRQGGLADFTAVPVVEHIEEPLPLVVADDWKPRLREVSTVFIDHPDLHLSTVTLDVETELSLHATSEGARIQSARRWYRVSLSAGTVADDGMQVELYEAFDAADEAGLPSQEALLAAAEELAQRVEALRAAPLLEPFSGPVLLSGRASGVFFHEVFGHRIEGHRQRSEDEGQTFKDMVGESILPPFLSVIDDPTRAQVGEVDLRGHYAVDDEGVAAEVVTLVEAGVLRTFLMSRRPIEGLAVSNGHGRREPGNTVVPRQGNLVVETTRGLDDAALRSALLAEIDAQDKPYGLYVGDITGGFTLTGRVLPNSFNVRAVEVWRVYADGRPDELVRGGDLIGTPIATFSRILASGDTPEVFNGTCGAESGWVPVSAVSPPMLVGELEVQRKEIENDLPPLLPQPMPRAASSVTP